MPIYEYQCKACGDVQELMQKMTDPAPADCPLCHGGPMVKLVSKTAFILKGNGWYVTDFRDKGKASGDKADGGAASPTVAAPSEGGAAKSEGAAAPAKASPSESTGATSAPAKAAAAPSTGS